MLIGSVSTPSLFNGLDTKLTTYFLSPAFSKKSGGTLFLVFRGAWCVARGAWRVVRGSEFLVGTLSP